MAIHGYAIPEALEKRVFKHAGNYFTTFRVQQFVEDNDRDALIEASEGTRTNGRQIDFREIANRVADKLVQKWKREGKIELGLGRQWVLKQ
ncbi:MAG: hypothetical protein WC869_01120 [Phycisphaerae bacterium]|jgi:hypothetical protein